MLLIETWSQDGSTALLHILEQISSKIISEKLTLYTVSLSLPTFLAHYRFRKWLQEIRQS